MIGPTNQAPQREPTSYLAEPVSQYTEILTKQFQKFRAEGLYIDGWVTVRTETFGVHKIVFCAASEYFRTAFAKKDRIDLSSLFPADELIAPIIDFVYTGQLQVPIPARSVGAEAQKLFKTLHTARLLKLPGLWTQAERALCSDRYISDGLANRILDASATYGTIKVTEACLKFLNRGEDNGESNRRVAVRDSQEERRYIGGLSIYRGLEPDPRSDARSEGYPRQSRHGSTSFSADMP